jgi:hypothetical protein
LVPPVRTRRGGGALASMMARHEDRACPRCGKRFEGRTREVERALGLVRCGVGLWLAAIGIGDHLLG